MLFRNRRHAGKLLADAVYRRGPFGEPVVLGLPRGGVPVAYEVAARLDAPLDVVVVRKLGIPGRGELAMGAIATGDVVVVDDEIVRAFGVDPDDFRRVLDRERVELARRERELRGDRPPVHVLGRAAIVVDDGLATGSTMRAAVTALRRRAPRRVYVATPIAAPPVCAQLGSIVDGIVCLATPESLHSVGLWYEDFRPTADDEVRALLIAARGARGTYPIEGATAR